MKIGLISDSHDNLPKIAKAVRFFHRVKVGFVFHAGDFIAPFSIAKLDILKCDWRGVFGNNDGETLGLLRASEGKIMPGPLRMELAGRKIIMVHDIQQINKDSEGASLIIFGHSHQPQIIKDNNRLLINPGECGGWLSGKSTVALVDLETLSARIITI